MSALKLLRRIPPSPCRVGLSKIYEIAPDSPNTGVSLGPYFVALAYKRQETDFDSNKMFEFNRWLKIGS